VIFVLASIFTVLSSYVVALASMSPTPPLHGTTIGSFIVVSTATKELFLFFAVEGMLDCEYRVTNLQTSFSAETSRAGNTSAYFEG